MPNATVRPAGRAHLHMAISRRLRRVGLTGFAGLCMMLATLAPAAAAQADTDTWVGQGTPSQVDGNLLWSDGANWDSGNAPSAGDTLVFGPDSCTSQAVCENDLTPGTLFGGVSVSSSGGTAITGKAITLDGPLSVSGASTSPSNLQATVLDFPIAVGTDQTWTISGSQSGDAPLITAMEAPVTGDHAVNVGMSDEGAMWLDADTELGTVTTQPSVGNGSSPVQGIVVLGASGDGTPASLNGTDGNPVILNQSALFTAGFNASYIFGNAPPNQTSRTPPTTGPLTLNGSLLAMGNFGPVGLAVNGPVTMDSNSQADFTVNSSAADPTPGVDFTQLSATGDVSLGSAGLQLELNDSGCPPPAGTSYPLVTTSGTISGTFADVPDGAVVDRTASCNNSTVDVPFRINYTATAVTATVMNTSATSLSANPSSSHINQPVTLTATVDPESGTATGTVEFDDNGSAITGCGAQPLSTLGGVITATCTTSTLANQDALTATFRPDGQATDRSSTSNPALTYSVTPGPTTTALSRSRGGSGRGWSFTYTATVSTVDSGPYAPTGVVVFSDGTQPIDCGAPQGTNGQPIDGSEQATCAVTYQAAGRHSITAHYQGDGNFSASTSSPSAFAVGAGESPPETTTTTTTTTSPPTTTTTTTTTTTSAPTPVTSSPPPAPSSVPAALTVGKPVVHGSVVMVPVTCPAGARSCTITAQMTTLATVVSNRLMARLQEAAGWTVGVAHIRATLRAGTHRLIRIALNRTGRRMLSRRHRLSARLVVIGTGRGTMRQMLATTVTFRASRGRRR